MQFVGGGRSLGRGVGLCRAVDFVKMRSLCSQEELHELVPALEICELKAQFDAVAEGFW